MADYCLQFGRGFSVSTVIYHVPRCIPMNLDTL